MKTLKHLFLEELGDRLDSEKQLVLAMPKMIEITTCSNLKKVIKSHLKETEGHVSSLEGIFKSLNEKFSSKKCQATIGILKEGDEIAALFKDSFAINAALVSTAQKIEHYEIASYGCLHEWAKLLNHNSEAEILQSILDEEHAANKSLVELAVSKCNEDALGGKCTEDSDCKPSVNNKHMTAGA